jgi:hypothetical protein
MVIVGWPRPLVTKLLPSQINRLGMSCVRWKRSTTDFCGLHRIAPRLPPCRLPSCIRGWLRCNDEMPAYFECSAKNAQVSSAQCGGRACPILRSNEHSMYSLEQPLYETHRPGAELERAGDEWAVHELRY